MSIDPRRIVSCPACSRLHTGHPSNPFAPHYCSLACFEIDQPTEQPAPPSCHDGVTMACPVCQHAFVPIGRQVYCSDACRAAAYRRRRDAARPAVSLPRSRPRRPVTVYECDACGERALGEQRCECGTFMRRVGIGGCCPVCEAPLAVAELLGEEVRT